MTNAPRRDAPAEASGLPLLKVGELVLYARQLMETGIPDVWVEGDVIEAKRAGSGHVYFTLADGAPEGGRRVTGPDARLDCVVFNSDQGGIEAEITVGVRVRVRGRASVFPQQSSLQLVVVRVLAAGVGDRAAKLARLREKLRKEGLFDPRRKRRLPRLPRLVGLVTSKKGAALHDVLTVARRRFPVRILLAHCLVQGPDAARSITAGIEALARVPGIDVLIVARGGGASEDLSAFDEESVARAIAAFPVPVVTGIGHEVDVTLADHAADVRAATPSNAAELVVPDRDAVRAELAGILRTLQHRFDARLVTARRMLERATARLGERRGTLRARRERLRATESVLERAARRRIERDRRKLAALSDRLALSDPRRALARAHGELAKLRPRLVAAMRAQIASMQSERTAHEDDLARAIAARIDDGRHALAVAGGRLDALSPLAVLSRGYAIALDARGRAVTRASDVSVGDTLEIRVERGAITARVEKKQDPP